MLASVALRWPLAMGSVSTECQCSSGLPILPFPHLAVRMMVVSQSGAAAKSRVVSTF